MIHSLFLSGSNLELRLPNQNVDPKNSSSDKPDLIFGLGIDLLEVL